jgi:hypothetical protein
MLQKRDGRTRVYRRRNVRFARNCILEVDNFGGRRQSVVVLKNFPLEVHCE